MRKKSKLTQKDLSKILNKPQSFVSKYEIGDRNLDIIELISICKACNTKPTEFIQNLSKKLN